MISGIASRGRGWVAWVVSALLFAGAHGALADPAVGAAALKVPPIGERHFAGVVSLAVDATDLTHKVFQIKQRLPLQGAGPVTLLYPQWQGASHAPTGQVGRVAGLVMRSGGRQVAWTRDAADPFAFHVRPPAGARELEVAFTYVSPRSGNLAMSRNVVNVGWSNLLLYPAGFAAHRISVAAQVQLPAGMQFATSLAVDGRDGDVVRFKAAALDTLVDSPLLAGRHARTWPLSDRPGLQVTLSAFASQPEDLVLDDASLAKFRASVAEVQAMFGASRREPYQFMVVLDERMGGPGGIEHRHCTEVFVPANYFTRAQDNLRNLDLAVHEYVHAWNGTQFLPAGMKTRNFSEPLQNSLLWVYEGLTQYLGKVAAARGGMRTLDEALDDLAIDAARTQVQPSRAWKPLRDSVYDPITISGRGIEWPDFTGKKDYYVDGVLLWLAADVEIRTRTAGHKSLDDFVRLFFGNRKGDPAAAHTYTEADLYAALNQVSPGDWKRFFDARLDALDSAALMAALERGGYRLAYTADPTETYRQDALDRGVDDYLFSLGLSVGKTGALRAVRWDGPAFRAGLTVGAKLLRVNGQPYDAHGLKAAVTSGAPLTLAAELEGERLEVRIEANSGLRYPRLERLLPGPSAIDAIFTRRPGRTAG